MLIYIFFGIRFGNMNPNTKSRIKEIRKNHIEVNLPSKDNSVSCICLDFAQRP